MEESFFDKLFYKILGWCERKKSIELRKSTYRSYWPYFRDANVLIGDLLELGADKYLLTGMSMGPGFPFDSGPFQFKKIPIKENGNKITFFHPSIISSMKKVRHISPAEFKSADRGENEEISKLLGL